MLPLIQRGFILTLKSGNETVNNSNKLLSETGTGFSRRNGREIIPEVNLSLCQNCAGRQWNLNATRKILAEVRERVWLTLSYQLYHIIPVEPIVSRIVCLDATIRNWHRLSYTVCYFNYSKIESLDIITVLIRVKIVFWHYNPEKEVILTIIWPHDLQTHSFIS